MSIQDNTPNIRSILMEIVERIRKVNLEDPEDRIPTSDIVYRRILGDLGENPDVIERYLRILIDAHYLISFKIVEADEARKVSSINGYVIAEHGVLNAIYEQLCLKIETLYESQFYQRKSPGTIIKEILGKGTQFRNTPLGHGVNATVMLQQYMSILKSQAEEYTEAWRLARLNHILADVAGKTPIISVGPVTNGNEKPAPVSASENTFGIMMEEEEAGISAPAPDEEGIYESRGQRAVDTQEFLAVEEMDRSGKWGDAVEKFGVEFLLRIHFRKYEFDRVIFLIKTNRIVSEKDLRYVRDTMRKLDLRMKEDPELVKHRGRITDLRRLAQMSLNRILMRKKGQP